MGAIQKISVALCTCNGERFIGEQLASIAAQTHIPDEIVLFDDASGDRTLGVVSEFAKTLPIHVHGNTCRMGSTPNFAKAVASCAGDVIFLCDQDDIWEPGKVERFLESFSSPQQPGLVFSDAALIDEQSRPLESSLWERNRFSARRQDRFRKKGAIGHLLRSNIVTGATAAFRADLLDAILPIPDGWIHDYWIATVASCLSSVHCEPARLTRYRIHSRQQIGIHKNRAAKLRTLLANPKDLATEICKYETLLNRIAAYHGGDAGVCDARDRIADKVRHLEARALATAKESPDFAVLVHEAVKGNYSRFSYGWLDVLSDFIVSIGLQK